MSRDLRPIIRPAACLLGAVAILGATPASRQERIPETVACPDGRYAPALQTVREVMASERLPSISIAVGERGERMCEAAFGWADRERRVAASPATMYSLASISKPFTATAIMRLVEQQQVALDRPANDYLGDARLRAFEGRAEDATVMRLLTHTAGLPLHYQFFYAGGPEAPSMDAAIRRYGVIVYPPGERYFYANFGYGVLERIVERASRRSYAEALEGAVFEPLGLAATTVSDGAGLDARRAALRYGADGAAIPPYTFDHVGASGVWSSARDLIAFGMFHLGKDPAGVAPPISQAARSAMQRAHAEADGPGRARGLGWGIVESVGGWKQVAHTGSMPGVSTILTLYPQAQVTVTVLTNVNNSRPVARIERALAAAALPTRSPSGGSLQPTVEAADSRPAAPQEQPFRADAALLGRWTGTVTVGDEQRRLVLDIADAGARIRVGDGAETAIENLRFSNRWLTARTEAVIAPTDAAPASARGAHRSTLTLALREGRLSGWVTSLSSGNPLYGAVSFPMLLTKRQGTEAGGPPR